MTDLVTELLKLAAKKNKPEGTATKRDPKKWSAAKSRAKAKMGGKWSARAAQLAVKYYKDSGGKYKGKKPSAKNNKLKKWTKQDWQWSGDRKKKSSVDEALVISLLEFSKEAGKKKKGKGVYLPAKSIDALKSSEKGRKNLRAASRKKAKATREGEQHASHGLHKGKDRSKLANRAAIGRELAEGIGHFLSDSAGLIKKPITSPSTMGVSQLSRPVVRLPSNFKPSNLSNFVVSEVKRNAINKGIQVGKEVAGTAMGKEVAGTATSYAKPMSITESKRVGGGAVMHRAADQAADAATAQLSTSNIPTAIIAHPKPLPRTAENIATTVNAKTQATMDGLRRSLGQQPTPSSVTSASPDFTAALDDLQRSLKQQPASSSVTPSMTDYTAGLAGDATQAAVSTTGADAVGRAAGNTVQSGIETAYSLAPHSNLGFVVQRELMGGLQRAGGYEVLGKVPGVGAPFKNADEAVKLVKQLEASGGVATNNEAFVRSLRETGDPNRAFMAHLEANPFLRQLQRDALAHGGAFSTPTNFGLTATGLAGLRPGYMADTSFLAGSKDVDHLATIQAIRNRLLQQGTKDTSEIMAATGYLQAPTLKTTGVNARSGSVGSANTATGNLPDYLLNRAGIEDLQRLKARLNSAIGRRSAGAGSGSAVNRQDLPGILADMNLISDRAAGEATNLLSSSAPNAGGGLFQGQANRGFLRRRGEGNAVMRERLARAKRMNQNQRARLEYNRGQARRYGQSVPQAERPYQLIDETLAAAQQGFFKGSSIKLAEDLIKAILEEVPSSNRVVAAYQLGKKLAALTTR